MLLRSIRIAAIAGTLALLFEVSRRAGIARGNGELPGLLYAIGVLAAIFFVRAAATEATQGPEANKQKDFLWGLCLGAVTTILVRI